MASLRSTYDPVAPKPLQARAPEDEQSAGHGALEEGQTVDLNATSAVLDSGLLMVFGPEGDPLPPGAFCPAAAAQPEALVRLWQGARVPAHRVAAVLEAQIGGRLVTAEDAGAWLEAMLDPARQPAMATPPELQAEAGACDVILYGREIVVAIPTGPSFVIATARTGQPGDLRCRLAAPDGAPVRLRDLVASLREQATGRVAGESARLAEIVVPGSSLVRQGDVLLLATASGARCHISSAAGAPVDETIVDLLKPDREPVGIECVLGAVRASALEHEPSP